MNFETRLRGRPRNRWQDEVKKDGRLVGGTGWRERVHNREEWKTSWWNWVEGKSTQQRGMEEAAENGKESSHSAHANE